MRVREDDEDARKVRSMFKFRSQIGFHVVGVHRAAPAGMTWESIMS